MSQASVDLLDVTYLEPDTTLRIQLEKVELDYTLSQLIKGQADSLIISSVALTLDQQPSEQSGPAPTLPTIKQLLDAYNVVDPNSFPLTTLQLPVISVSHNLASETGATFDTAELSAELSKQENQLKTKLVFANKQQLMWAVGKDTGWRLQFFDTPEQAEANSRKPVFKASLKQVDQSLLFHADIKPELSQRWLPTQQTESPSKLSDIALSATIRGNNPEPGLAVLSTIEMSSLIYQGLDVQAINAQFDLQIAQALLKSKQRSESWQIYVESNSSLSLSRASFTDWQANDVALSINGDASLAQDVSEITSSDIQLSVAKLQQASELELSDISFTGAVSALLDAEQWQLKVADSWALSSQYSRLSDTELVQGWSLSSAQPLNLTGVIESADTSLFETIVLEKTELEIAIPIVQDNALELRIKPQNTSLKIEQANVNKGELYAKGLLAIPQLTLDDIATGSQQEITWQLDNVNQVFELKNEQLTSKGSVQSIERDLYINTTSTHDFKKQKGKSDFRFKTLTFNNPQRLNQLAAPIEPPVSLVTGEVDLSGHARWRNKSDEWQTTVDINAQLDDLGGAYDQAYFSGASGQLSLQVHPELISKKPHRLKVAHIDAGIENTNVALEFKLRPSKFGDLPRVDILQAQTQLLLGSIKLKPTTLDLNRPKQALQVILENIDLNELVTLQQLDDIQATGLISGQLPIVINGSDVSVDNGQLQALAPGGVLQYQANADALSSNKYAETVVLALRDFRYDDLRADTQYQPDGTLLLKLQLQGSNPEFEQGRQINLNINLEQNVLKLLESLRLYDGVSDRLDKRVQEFYQQSTSPKAIN